MHVAHEHNYYIGHSRRMDDLQAAYWTIRCNELVKSGIFLERVICLAEQ
jgi:hypothetical protein